MSETVIIRQTNDFETTFLAAQYTPGMEIAPEPVAGVHELTPYGMMLAGLGGCTTIVLHTYAQQRGLPLDAVTIRLRYERDFLDDCEHCEEIDRYEERIVEEIMLEGALDDATRQRLFRVAHHCPIYKMYRDGIHVDSSLTHEL